MNPKIRNEQTDYLFKAILNLNSIDECYEFFEDLCTVSEIKAMAQRLEVAKMLSENHVYTEIAKKTGASSATISRVNRCLVYGSDGYQKMLSKLKEAK